MRKIALLLAVVMVLSLALTGCAEAPKTELLSVCVGPSPDTIDPALNSAVDGATMIIHAFEGLYTLDKNGTPVPGQAESVDISNNGTTYTFKLRKNLKWTDGTPLTAQDFIYSWNRAIDPKLAADYEYMFDVIKGYDTKKLDVTATDDNTLVVNLISAVPYFLELTAFPAYSPVQKATIETNGDKWATKVETYVSNGPYKMTEWVEGSYVMYERNPNYWNYKKLGSEKIKFVLMDDNVAQLAAYNANELQFIDDVPNDEIDALKARPDFYKEGQLGTYYVSFNVKKAPLDNPKFRQALSLAINRPWICTNIGKAGQVPAGAFVSLGLADATPGSSFREVGGDYYDPNDYEGNLAKAKAIIKELYPDGKIPKIEYIYNTSTGHKLIAEALQSDWAKLGVTTEIQSQEWATFLNTRKNHEYQVARNGWLNDYNDPVGMLDLFITGGGNNDAAWSNPKYDALIKEIKSSSDPKVRFAKMHEAEKLLFDDFVMAPIYYYVDLYMLNEKVDGAFSSPLGFKYFMYASIKK